MSRFSAATEVLEQAIAARVFPGAVFGVLLNGEAAMQEVGTLGYGPQWPAVTTETIYDLASVTKVVATTALAMKLWQDGKLRLETPVCEVLPQFAGEGPRRAQVTLAMLLAHTSGLPAYRELYLLPGLAAGDAAARSAAIVNAACATPLVNEPGARDEYSDIGFIVLGAALAALAGAPLRESFCNSITAPLGLKIATYLPAQNLRSSIAPGCDWKWRHRVVQGEVQDENCAAMGGVSGHAGLFSNCADVLRFASAILGEGQFFSPATIAKFAQRVRGPRALGWDTPSGKSQSGQYFSPRSIGHLGYTGTSLWIDLDRQIAIVLLANRCYTGSDAPPLKDREAILHVRPRFHDAVMREIFPL